MNLHPAPGVGEVGKSFPAVHTTVSCSLLAEFGRITSEDEGPYESAPVPLGVPREKGMNEVMSTLCVSTSNRVSEYTRCTRCVYSTPPTLTTSLNGFLPAGSPLVS